jgi:hypothetical protein
MVVIVNQSDDDIGDRGYDIHTRFGRVDAADAIKLGRDWTNRA